MIHDGLYPYAPEQDGFDVFDAPPEQIPVTRIGTGPGYFREAYPADFVKVISSADVEPAAAPPVDNELSTERRQLTGGSPGGGNGWGIVALTGLAVWVFGLCCGATLQAWLARGTP